MQATARCSRLFLFVSVVFIEVLTAGCQRDKLRSDESALQATVTELRFEPRYPGQTSELSFELFHESRAEVPVAVQVAPPSDLILVNEHPDPLPFDVVDAPKEVPSVGAKVTLRFAPLAAGEYEGRVSIQSESGTLLLVMRGTGLSSPDCAAQDDCHRAYFDETEGACVQEALEDGAACGEGNACLLGGQCRTGVCVGQTLACDDGNACTLDVCDPLDGCQHPPAPPCPGNGTCQVGTCDPQAGCGLAPAEDGTRCGALTCDAANICIAGSCVVRDPPDGFACADASPCQSAGRCNGSTCERSPVTPLAPNWQFHSRQDGSYTALHDFVLEPDGALSLMGFFELPRMRVNRPSASEANTFARRCLIWGTRLVCADYSAQGIVGALDLATGAPVWSYNFPAMRPELAAGVEPGRMFMARVAVMAPDRIAALFEAYPRGTSDLTECRAYFVVVLDAQGREVYAQQLRDPLLDVCNHPHPFGVAADASGTLFLSFSPTTTSEAPLYAGKPTLLMSYSRDGVFKWKRTENDLYGGELAVSKGLLFPERGATAYQANTGAPILAVTLNDGRFGRVGLTDRQVIPSPLGTFSTAGTKELVAYHFNGVRSWTHTLPGSDVFISDQMRLAGYRPVVTGPAKTVALVFRSVNGQPALTAVDTATGTESWTCPVVHSSSSSPQLFEVARGQLTLMENAQTCGHCDPPFANSRGSFYSFAIPGLETARVPWAGAFGGADHDHREDVFAPMGQ